MQLREARKIDRKASRPSKSLRRGRKRSKWPSAANPESSEFWEILGRFDQAISLVTVCHQSLAAKECTDVGDEEEVLGQSIRLLKQVHSDLDRSTARIKGKRGPRLRQLVAEAP